MTIDEIREKYGDERGYVKCHNCPCEIGEGAEYCACEVGEDCNGRSDAYTAIQNYFNATKATTDTPNDTVSHPAHYTNGGMECIDEMILIFGKEAVKHFCLCNAWKYRRRALYKNGEEDMQKSHWYLEKYKELGGDANE